MRALCLRLPRTLTVFALTSALGCSGPEPTDLGQMNSDPDGGPPSTAPNEGSNFSPGSETCEELRFDGTQTAPEVMIALDQSSSMEIEGRWGAAVDAVSSVVRSLDGQVSFGLSAFGTNRFSCGSTRLVSAPQMNNADAIIDYMRRSRPEGGTPIAAVLEQIADFKADGGPLNDANGGVPDETASLAGVSAVILVTDGAPNCNARLDPNACTCTHTDQRQCARAVRERNGTLCLDDDGAAGAVERLRGLGVETHVIGYSTSQWADTLDRLAAAGTGGKYIPVNNALELEQSLQGVASGIGTCSFALEQAPADVTHVRVMLNDAQLSHQSLVDQGGWSLEGQTIQLHGSDCDLVRDEPETTLNIEVACEQVFVIR